MKTKLIVFVIILFTFINAQTKFVSVKGKDFIDEKGNPILLKGIGLGNWLNAEGYMLLLQDPTSKKVNSQRLINELFCEMVGEVETAKFWKSFWDNYVTKDDIHFIKSCGFNSIRIPFNYKMFVSCDDYNKLEGIGYEILDRVIDWCKEENLYVILDMHAAPCGQTGGNIDDSYGYPFLYENEDCQQLTIQLWKKLAQKYANEPIVIGYDLLNEPIPHFFDMDKLNPLLEPLYKKIVSAIRTVDKNHIIFLGGAQWNSNFSVFGPPFDDKLAYTFHKYWTDTTQAVIQSYIDYSNKYNVPLWMGESGENTNEWIASFTRLLEKNNIGWCYWPYKKMESPRGVVSIPKPNDWDVVIKFAKSSRSTFEEIRQNRPDIQTSKNALNELPENIKLKNCIINYDYLKALGLNYSNLQDK
ncbi:MAG: hypothetical protein STSR0008_22820 [Ignavibacterium sp.]